MKTGNHKLKGGVEFLGAQIVYYIRQKKPLIEGDKFANRFGAKGIIGKVILPEHVPKPEFSPRVDVFISPIGVFSRKNLAMVKEIYLGKIMYFLNKKVREMSNNPKITTDQIIKLINDMYGLLGSKKVVDSVAKYLENISPNSLRKKIKEGKLILSFMVIPFTTVSFEQIKTGAEHLGIPLDEKIYLPEFDITTKNAVPVGITYGQALEQISEVYASVRSSGRYQGLTGQATKGKAREGGQTIGPLDVNALLTYDAPAVLTELLTLRSDDHRSKRKVINEIISNGSATLPKFVGKGGTTNLMHTFIKTMGLSIR